MKKALLVTTLSLIFATSAMAQNNFYVQGDLGYAKVTDGKDPIKGFSPRLSAGYDLGDVRLALDYTHYKGKKFIDQDRYSVETSDVKFNSIGFSAIYDFDLQSQIKPYVGVRLGLNKVKINAELKAPNYYESDKFSKTKTGLGILFGASYKVVPNLELDAGYRYNYWGKFADDAFKIKSHEFSTGLRYSF
ncbi:Opacity protein and related surface antigens [Phocoenobacter uteri]|uniref:Opacity protein and related surface antigens n=1 Tax=Phocoenobacter uteri TaxID=146806 RepID=A0A379C841_9PAST|nr:opacity family porin [Phocoenobacter uteri]MDG6882185.1 hypothetical protein [Phocoenobacter uteri]SUB58339.1 Opacity protein and related surface antigens [Phocoenobacter uteri]